ncbi:MAG TPA: MlaA family lipoprotein [Candidatus Azosocius sp. HAIN]
MFYLYFIKIRFLRFLIFLIFLILFSFLVCEAHKFYDDPIEYFNRKSYFINKNLDNFFLKPITISYLNTMPIFFVNSIENVIQNYNEFFNIFNSLVQFDINDFFNNFFREFVNSFFGIFGIFDIAYKFKFFSNKKNYGKILNYLGYNKSIYLVLPILGSCTIRDILGLLISNDFIVNKFYLESYIKYYYILYILYERIFLLYSEKIFMKASVDEYILSKNVYLQYIIYQYNK